MHPLVHVDGPGYWRGVFQAMALNPLGAGLIYTIANLVVTSAFPAGTQALAGSVFNMLAQIGKSVGIATSSVVARQLTMQVTMQVNGAGTKEELLRGYKAAWWYSCSLDFTSVAVSF